MLEIPIRVFSFGGSAGDFSEDTRTVVVNRDGALIILRHRVAADAIVRIINLENFREADFRVVGLSRQEGGRYSEWGVECMDRDRCLWEIEFPPPMEVNDSRGGALLQCQGCGKQSFVVLSLTEVSILDSNSALEKLCEKCGELKLWTYADEVRLPKEGPHSTGDLPATLADDPLRPNGAVFADQWEKWLPPEAKPTPDSQCPPGPGAVAVDEQALEQLCSKAPPGPQPQRDRKVEKRLHKRLTLKLPAFVRNQKGETEVARTENISKGGLGVGLRMTLALGEMAVVVCPYTGSGQEIEQRAEVRRRVSLYGGQKWFYGFRYTTQ